ncbi:hypothetical protein OIU77_012887 [Salix suchowensis]|uniref:Uncharacterized protein n=1 Tax=Salix suchowensis TaxID=1278906 RepID=A0ABQ9A6E5_9ROSI|nr:hypothetical protein OIU77_012887 [Salix suchowensis]
MASMDLTSFKVLLVLKCLVPFNYIFSLLLPLSFTLCSQIFPFFNSSLFFNSRFLMRGTSLQFWTNCPLFVMKIDIHIALDFLHRFPFMTTTMDGVLRSNRLIALSTMPALFHSGDRLALWQQWIYSCICIQPIVTAGDNFRLYMPDQSLSGSKNIILQVVSKLRGFAINLLTFLGIKQIYDLKKIHIYSDKILQCMCEYISNLDFEVLFEADIEGAFYNAAKNDMVEFVIEVIKTCPHVMNNRDNLSRTLFTSSIANRNENVFYHLLYRHKASRAATFVFLIDEDRNTILHMEAKLSPPSQLARISGEALQMQRELQWYKKVESIIMNPTLKDFRNRKNQTARELFTNDHKDLLVKGE